MMKQKNIEQNNMTYLGNEGYRKRSNIEHIGIEGYREKNESFPIQKVSGYGYGFFACGDII